MKLRNQLKDKNCSVYNNYCDKEEVAEKTVTEMGKSYEIREGVCETHYKKPYKNLIYVLLVFFMVVSTQIFGYSGLFAWSVDGLDRPSPASVAISSILIPFIFYIMYKCRKKRESIILGLLSAYFILAAIFVVFPVSPFQPAFYAIDTVINSFFANPIMSTDNLAIAFYMIFCLCCALYCLVNATKTSSKYVCKYYPRIKNKISIIIFLTATTVVSLAVSVGYQEQYTEYNNILTETVDKYTALINPSLSAAEKKYDELSLGMATGEINDVLGSENETALPEKYDSYYVTQIFTDEVKSSTKQYKAYHLVPDPKTTGPEYLATVIVLLDKNELLIGKQFIIDYFFNSKQNGTSDYSLALFESLKVGMSHDEAMYIVHNTGIHPADITYQTISGHVKEQYTYYFERSDCPSLDLQFCDGVIVGFENDTDLNIN